jgi:hypothetical protein
LNPGEDWNWGTMRKSAASKLGACILLAFFLFTSRCFADFLVEHQAIDLTSGERGHIGIFLHDGFLRDSFRAVIGDKEGRLLAATPQSGLLLLDCPSGGSVDRCSVFDRQTGIIYVPNTKEFALGDMIDALYSPSIEWHGFDLKTPLHPSYWTRIIASPGIIVPSAGLFATFAIAATVIPLLVFGVFKTFASRAPAENAYQVASMVLFALYLVLGFANLATGAFSILEWIVAGLVAFWASRWVYRKLGPAPAA